MRHSEPRTLTSSSTSSHCAAFSLSYSKPWWRMQLKQYPCATRAGDPQCPQGTKSISIWAELELPSTFKTDSRDCSNCASRPQLLADELSLSRPANRSLSASISMSWGTISPFPFRSLLLNAESIRHESIWVAHSFRLQDC